MLDKMTMTWSVVGGAQSSDTKELNIIRNREYNREEVAQRRWHSETLSGPSSNSDSDSRGGGPAGLEKVLKYKTLRELTDGAPGLEKSVNDLNRMIVVMALLAMNKALLPLYKVPT